MTKLSKLMKIWPSGTIASTVWLEEHHIYRQLRQKYVNSGWITPIGHGAFIRAGDKPKWQGGVYALQKGLNMPIHVGGRSALEMLGRAHFIPMGKQNLLYIYTHSEKAEFYIPKWFTSYFSDTRLEKVNLKLFKDLSIGLQTRDCGEFELTISGSERAVLEVLALVPKKISFEHAYLLVEGQNTLRVEILQKLLENCRSQLLKRLFLHLAKRCDLPSFERLNLKKIVLGKSKRTIGKGGIYDSEFKLYVPKHESDDENIEV